jgi:hypothetical protein
MLGLDSCRGTRRVHIDAQPKGRGQRGMTCDVMKHASMPNFQAGQPTKINPRQKPARLDHDADVLNDLQQTRYEKLSEPLCPES